MNTFDNLFSRRSIRSYTGEPITDAELQQILKAAYAAPVGRAQYGSLQLTVISNPEFLDKWQSAAAAALGNPAMRPLYGAPTVVLVSSALPAPQAANLSYSNAAIVAHSMALAATELGVGVCHIWGIIGTLVNDPELLKELELPEGMVPCCAVALGHTGETYAVREIPDNRIQTSYLK